MPHKAPSHSTLEPRNPERALYDSYKEVADQAPLESSQPRALTGSGITSLTPGSPVQTHGAEPPANISAGAKKEPRTSKGDSARWNSVTIAFLGVALAGIIVTAAVVGIKTSQHGSSQSSTSSVSSSSVSSTLSSSPAQTTSQLKTTVTVRTETPSIKLSTSNNLLSPSIHQSQDPAILKSSSLVSRQEPLPNSESPSLLSAASNMPNTRSRVVADSPHVAATPVRPIDSSIGQTNRAQQAITYPKLSDTTSGVQAPSNIDQLSTTTSPTSSASSPQPTTSKESSRRKVTSTVDVRTITALDQLSPTNCLQSSDVWKGPSTADSPDTCDGA